MRTKKRKAVINAEEAQLDRIQRLIDEGCYRTVSEFVREALDEKLENIEQYRVAEAVERYCAAGNAGEDRDLIDAQSLEGVNLRPGKRARRASR